MFYNTFNNAHIIQVLCFNFTTFHRVGNFYLLSGYNFVIHRDEKKMKREEASLRADAEFAKEKKALKTTRINVIPLLGCC